MAKNEAMKLVANNKKAYHDYFIEEKYECGIALHGTEVKSLRMRRFSCMACTSPRTRREISLIRIRCA